MAVFELSHPLVKHKIGLLRDHNTKSKEFRELVEELTTFLVIDSTKNFETESYEVETPIAKTECLKLKDDIVAVPILRAGLGMVSGVLNLIPTARMGHIGLARDEETFEPKKYYYKMPDKSLDANILILDPMLATAGSMMALLKILKSEGYKKITVLNIVSSKQGLAEMEKNYPEIDIYTCQIDPELNENAYIVPGLGDAGDRYNDTFKLV